MVDARLARVQESLNALEKGRDLASAKNVVRNVSALLVPELSEDTDSLFRLFNDQDGKLKANAGWFFSDTTITDKLATYTLDTPAENNLDIKVYGVKKAKKGTISWAVGLTPNFEDEPFNGKFNVGIDFIIPESLDRVIVALSKNYVIRTLELKGQLTATFQEILNSWLGITDLSRKVEFHEILWNSLDLSPINKKFYEGISQRFILLRQHIETSGALDHDHAAQFANRLIGRVIFTWFLDKKSLIEPSHKYFDSEDFGDDTEYYRQKLEPLFFDVLNTPVPDRKGSDVITPYLNGGLFESKPGDLYQDMALSFPKNYFDDFFAFLRAYNFTTDESTAEFQQVAIDPEMLGRIFENLLAEVNEETGEQARKAKGAFYTPRQIVDFMCKESLKSYLRDQFPNQSLPEERVFQIVDASERDFQDQDHNWRRDLKPYKDRISAALDQLRVLDPACGSGAFPLGMLQLLVKVYLRLDPRLDQYKTKLSIIENNLYGVDVEPMAVEITRLRTWLALVVDEDGRNRNVQPLPNLDFKFVCANSLMFLDDSTQITLFDNVGVESSLFEIRQEYFSTGNLTKKKSLRNKYDEIVDEDISLGGDSLRTAQLKSFRPFDADAVASFFDPGQMFGFEHFHIVIGNPPYVNVEKIDPLIKAEARKYKTAFQKYDLYILFYERALSLLEPNGTLSFITSNKFLSQAYGKVLREELLKTKINVIVNFDVDVFESATVRTCILITQKCEALGNSFRVLDAKTIEAAGDFSVQKFSLLNQSELGASEDANFRLSLSPEKSLILEKIRNNGRPLGDYCAINYGLRPVSKDGKTRKKDLVFDEKFPGAERYFEGKNLGLWNIKEFLYLKYEPQFLYNAMFPELFSKNKLVGLCTLSDITKLRFAFDASGAICNHSVGVVTLWHELKDVDHVSVRRLISEEKISLSATVSYDFLQGVLNSSVVKFFFSELFYDGTHFYPNQIRAMPIPHTNAERKGRICQLVIQLREMESSGVDTMRSSAFLELEGLVASSFGLSPEDQNLITSSVQPENRY